jgi:Na+-transporting methylmalonyl-CoA/oxaloacetate decarboxylase gamma subunit
MAFNNWLLLWFFFLSILVQAATFISKRVNTADNEMKWWNRDWHKNTTQNRGRLSPVMKTAARKPRES